MVYQTVFKLPLIQHPGGAGSETLPAQSVVPEEEIPIVIGVALHGKSFAGAVPVKVTSVLAPFALRPLPVQVVTSL